MLTVQPPESGNEVDPDDYYFYHTIDLPDLGEMTGEWDLRSAPEEYLGNINVTNKRVLEVGAANGFLSFHMEKKGASVVSYNPSPTNTWDAIPYADRDTAALLSIYSNRIRKINNAYRLSHTLLESRAEFFQGTIYAIPNAIGLVDISAFNNILSQVRDPFLALEQAARITRETMVVTDIPGNNHLRFINHLSGWLGDMATRKIRHKLVGPAMMFRPASDTNSPAKTWWHLTPELVEEFLRVLGFGDISLSYHRQHVARHNRSQLMFTLVANRTAPMRLT